MAKEVLEMEVKSNIGEVSKGIDKAAKSTEKLADETKKVDGATKTASKGFKGMGTAIKGMGMALKAAGIGLVVALFVALKEAVERNQKAMDLMETVMSTVSTTFNQVVTVLTDVVKWVTESSDRFDGLGKVLSGVITLSLTPIKVAFYGLKLGVQELMLAWEDSFLGGGDEGKIAELRADIVGTREDLLEVGTAAINAGKDIGNNIGDAISEVGAIYEKAAEGVSEISIKANYEQAKATTAATKAAKFAAAEFAKLNAEKLKEAELFRQIRDDETKTFAERIQANNDLKKSLEEQQKLQSDQIQKQITAAELAVQQNGNDENKLALMEAQNAQLELEETITGQLSEQKTNQVGLEKELLETQKEVRAEGLSGLERELQELQDAYDLKLEMARKSGEGTTAITKQYEKQKSDLVKANMLVQLDAYANLAGALSTLAGDNKELAVAEAVMATWSGATKALSEGAGTPAGWINAAAIIAAGLSNVSKIMAVDVGTGGGGGNVGSMSSTPAPQMMSGAFDISGGVAPEATKAYVVTDEMSNSQNQLANIRRRATI
jgi:hypothetical protein